MESVEGTTNVSNGASEELEFDRQKSAGDEEDDHEEESIFPLVIDPDPTRAAAPVGNATQSMPIIVGSPC